MIFQRWWTKLTLVDHVVSEFVKFSSVVKLILFLEMYLGEGLALSSQTVGSLLITLADKAGWENNLSIAPMDSTNSKIQQTGTFL